jgi:Flp pilus assembly protein TadD
VVLVVLVAVPAGLAKMRLGWPEWVIAAITAGVGVVATVVVTPLVAARVKLLTDRAAGLEERQRSRFELLQRIAGDGDLPLVRDVRSRATLGIHPATPLPNDADPDLSRDLPVYVPRDRDADVRTVLTRMMTVGGFLLLVGPPASGKTRCAAEAIQQLLGGWRLYLRSSGQDLAALLDAGVTLAQTVIWLDDIHELIDAGDRPGTLGGINADLVRRLLLPAAGPVIIIGTTWPDRRERYSAVVDAAGADLYADARRIMSMAEQIDLTRDFSAAEWDRARLLAGTDPRLADATGNEQDRAVTAALANTHELIRRWQHGADAIGRAVLSAAIDARRCGHPEPLPETLIEVLAPLYLTGTQRANADAATWLRYGLGWACTPIRADIAPLAMMADKVGVPDGYHVSDILIGAATQPGTSPVPDEVWRAIAESAEPSVCWAIALAAISHGLPVITERAAARGADAGDPASLFGLAILLDERGEKDEAEQLYRQAIAAGHVDAGIDLANLLRERGETDEAEQLYRQAIAAGRAEAVNNLAVVLGERGETDEAEQLYRQAIAAGDVAASYNLAVLLHKRSETDEAEQLYRQAIAAGDVDALNDLAVLLDERGEKDEAEQLYQQAIAAGHTGAANNLAVLLCERGEKDEAEQLFRQAIAAGFADAANNLANLLKQRSEITPHAETQEAAEVQQRSTATDAAEPG